MGARPYGSSANGQLEAIVERLPGGKGVAAAPPRELPWAAPPPRGAGLITALYILIMLRLRSRSRFLSRFSGNHGLVESAAEAIPTGSWWRQRRLRSKPCEGGEIASSIQRRDDGRAGAVPLSMVFREWGALTARRGNCHEHRLTGSLDRATERRGR